jgi:uridine kinase
MFHQFVYPSKTQADLVVPGGGKNAAATLALRNHIKSILENN